MYTYSTAAWTQPKYAIQYLIPQNSVKTQKFRRNGQIPWLGSKFRVLRKTVVFSYDARNNWSKTKSSAKHYVQMA